MRLPLPWSLLLTYQGTDVEGVIKTGLVILLKFILEVQLVMMRTLTIHV